MDRPLRILVTGARGFIGRPLASALEARGHDVVRLRRGEGAAPLDLAEIGRWRDWPDGIEAVAHLAALNPGRGDPASRDAAALHHANAAGTGALAVRAAAAGVGRFVFVSTANVHGPGREAAVGEGDAPRPQSAYAASKLAGEGWLGEIAAGASMEACVLRPSPVYGAGGGGTIAALARLARLPLPLPLADRRRRRSLVAVEDCVAAIVLALTHRGAANETFLVADPVPISPGEMVAAMRRGLGRPPLLLPFPGRPLGALAATLGRAEAFERLCGPFVLDARRIGERLGWRPDVSVEEGLGRLMRQTAG